MFSSLSLLFCTIATVSAYVVPRATPPATWPTGYLESYDVYHCRYLANSCQTQHGTTYFDTCCHPLLANESVSSLPAECQMPANTTCVNGVPSTITDETDGGDCGGEPSSAPTSTPTFTTPPPADTNTPSPTDTNTTPPPTDAYTPPPTTTTPPPTATTPPPDTTTSQPPTSAPANAGGAPSSSSPAAKPVSTGTVSSALNYGGIATYFYQNGNAGACGQVNPDTAFICALDSAVYGNGQYCGKQVQITNQNTGQSITVTVADECPTCENANSIDLSVGAFQALDSLSDGTFPIVWQFLD
ncbi:RlpA-like double-psi beta-barrel-protein domain-containing protein-containing protein [Scleroderma yunnanense]